MPTSAGISKNAGSVPALTAAIAAAGSVVGVPPNALASCGVTSPDASWYWNANAVLVAVEFCERELIVVSVTTSASSSGMLRT